MKNKILFILNSIKQSVVNKPIAFVFLFLVFFAMTICCSIPSRWFAGALNEEYYLSPNTLVFYCSPQDFKQNSVAIGDYIINSNSSIAFDEKNINSYLTVYHYNTGINLNNNPIDFENLSVNFVVTQNFGITESNILNKEKVVSVRDRTAIEYGIKEGDKINLYGNELTVQSLYDGWNDFSIPYNLSINEWYSCTPPKENADIKIKEKDVTGRVYNIKHSGINHFKNGLKKLNCNIDSSFDWGIFSVVMLVVSMLAICVLSSISIMGYWLKCNNKKYATYKTLGCSPTMLSFAIIVETLFIALFAIGLGLIVDYLIAISMQFSLPLGSFVWLHYLILIGGPLISIIIMTIIAVVRRAIAMPANTKYN